MKQLIAFVALAISALLATVALAQDEGKTTPAKPNPYVNNPDGDRDSRNAKTGDEARPDRPAVRTGRDGADAAPQPPRREESRRVGESPAQPTGPYLGVALESVPPALNEQLELRGLGAMVASVADGSPAAKAGIKPFDVIVAVNEEENVVKNPDALAKMLAGLKVGDKVRLFGVRKGKDLDLRVTLGEAKAASPMTVRIGTGTLTLGQTGTAINPWTGATTSQSVIRVEGQMQMPGASVANSSTFSGWVLPGPQMPIGVPGQPMIIQAQGPMGPPAMQPFVQAQPRMLTRFNTDVNGHIEVNLVRGQSEFNILFKNAEDFKAQSPALFQQYMMMLKGG